MNFLSQSTLIPSLFRLFRSSPAEYLRITYGNRNQLV
jgi:hypothetical protein